MASGKERTPAVQAPNLGSKSTEVKRQMNRNAAWPAEKGGRQQCRHRTWETKVNKSHGRHMNHAAWPAEKGGPQQCRHRTWETKVKKSHGRHMNRNAAGTEPGRQKSRIHIGDKCIEMQRGRRKKTDTSSAGTEKNSKLFGE